MRWPWSREVDAARAQALAASEGHAQAVQQRMATEQQNVEALEVTELLRDQLRRNGWTELLRQSWGGQLDG